MGHATSEIGGVGSQRIPVARNSVGPRFARPTGTSLSKGSTNLISQNDEIRLARSVGVTPT